MKKKKVETKVIPVENIDNIEKNDNVENKEGATNLQIFATKLKDLCEEYGFDIEAKAYLDVVKKSK